MDLIRDRIRQSILLKEAILNDEKLTDKIRLAVDGLVAAYKNGNKTIFCGNGGSAADAQKRQQNHFLWQRRKRG